MTGDEELVQRAQGGDRAAFATLVELHYTRIYRFSLKFCGNSADAEDVSQQACVKLGQSIRQFRFESAFTTWLYTLVLSCARDFEKSQRRHRLPVEPAGHTLAVDAVGEPAVYLGEVLEQIEQMGDGYKEAVVLVVGEGMSHAEAAATLAIRESTVSWRLHQVRKRLKLVAPEGFDER